MLQLSECCAQRICRPGVKLCPHPKPWVAVELSLLSWTLHLVPLSSKVQAPPYFSVLALSKEQEERTSKEQHAHFLISWAPVLLPCSPYAPVLKKINSALEQGTCMKQRGGQGLCSPLPAVLHTAPTVCLALMPTQQVGQYVLTYFTCFFLQVALMHSVNKSNSAKAPRCCSHFAAPTALSGESMPCIYIFRFARLHSSGALWGVKQRLESDPAVIADIWYHCPGSREEWALLDCLSWAGMRQEEFTLPLVEYQYPEQTWEDCRSGLFQTGFLALGRVWLRKYFFFFQENSKEI